MKYIALADVANIQLGKMLSPKSKTGTEPFPYLRNQNVQWQRFELADMATMDFSASERDKFSLRAGDLLVCEGGEPGRCAVWDGSIENCFYQKALHRLRPNSGVADSEFLALWIQFQALRGAFEDQNAKTTIAHLPLVRLEQLIVPDVPLGEQIGKARALKRLLAEVETASRAAETQLADVSKLAGAIIAESLNGGPADSFHLRDVLTEVKQGIGKNWQQYAVLGATREGLAPAKEPPGKHAVKYKPVSAGTVFYNPMRILIGSIAFVDDDDTPGITSPDYVVLRGREGLVDSRWFYYWLRSHLGVQCINSLARGAVRERMLFNRLADGEIILPDYPTQQRASTALKELSGMRVKLKQQLDEIGLLPQKILSQAFEN
jgi:type I restriction enzyme S subunit